MKKIKMAGVHKQREKGRRGGRGIEPALVLVKSTDNSGDADEEDIDGRHTQAKRERKKRGREDRGSLSFSEINDNSGDADEEDIDGGRTQAKRERKKRV